MHTVIQGLVVANSRQRHIRTLVQLMPCPTLSILTLYVVCGIHTCLRPVDQGRSRRREGVCQFITEGLRFPLAQHDARSSITMNHHNTVRDIGSYDITVFDILLGRTIHIHQTHRLSQVRTQLSHHHSHTHDTLLLVVDLHQCL